MTRPPDNAQVEAVFAILQNHCPAAAGNRLVARRIVAAVEHAAMPSPGEVLDSTNAFPDVSVPAARRASSAVAAPAPVRVVLLIQLPTRTVGVLFTDADEAARWATEQGVPPLLRPQILTKEEVIAELWRGGQ